MVHILTLIKQLSALASFPQLLKPIATDYLIPNTCIFCSFLVKWNQYNSVSRIYNLLVFQVSYTDKWNIRLIIN
jgi:hypothetical protein